MESPDPASLHEDGTAAFRAGRFAQAASAFGKAHAGFAAALGADHAQTLTALNDWGAAQAALHDHAAARATHASVLSARRRVLGPAHPETAASLKNLAAAHYALGELDAADASYAEAQAIWDAAYGPLNPLSAATLLARSALARDRGDPAAAVALAERAHAISTLSPRADAAAIAASLECLGQAHDAACDHDKALRAFTEALALPGPNRARLQYHCGMSEAARQDHAAALAWFRLSARTDPGFGPALHMQAAMLDALHRPEEAAAARAAALASHPVLVQRAAPGKLRVLIPSLATDGNVPLTHLLPRADFTRIFWFLAHDPSPEAPSLPAFDVVFNAIADPDRSAPAEAALAAFRAAHPAVKLLNPPERVAATRRDRLAAALDGIANIVVPRTLRLSRGEIAHARALTFPLLLRPAGAHGGTGVQRLDGPASLERADCPDTFYLCEFHDARGPDGFFRKYRVVFIGSEIFPYHLAISPNWLVHYFSADMPGHAWKLAEEARFLADPRAVLGGAAWRALSQIGARLGLDFAGIDFALTSSGEILVFEINPTMLIHPEDALGPLAHKTAFVTRITQAFAAHLQAART
jgi:tetratricopeptide (TPR) repeat protein